MKRYIKRVAFICSQLILIISLPAFADDLLILKERLKQIEQEKKEILQQIIFLESESLSSEGFSSQKPVLPSDKKQFKSNVALTYFWDSREYATFAISTSTTELPFEFSLWRFTDLHGNQSMGDDFFDFNRFFMEYRLSRQIDPEWFFGMNGLGVQGEFNDSNGSSNEVVRLGLTYKHPIPSLTNKKGWIQ